MQETASCVTCKGAGGCRACSGAGKRDGQKCLICRGRGHCPICGRAPSAEALQANGPQCRRCPRPALATGSLCAVCEQERASRAAAQARAATATPEPERRGPVQRGVPASTGEAAVVAGGAVAESSEPGRSGPGILPRAALALGLMVGFYFLAFGVAGALLFFAWIQLDMYERGESMMPFVVLGCLGGAAAILWAIVPRPDHFVRPGPRVTAERDPKLFALIDEVARATRQRKPAEVYLIDGLNAWVTQRGGIMGLGSRRVMAVGVPLLERLTISECRSVLAHEFGHYYGGDTMLGPWIYLTREAVDRTIASLEANSSWMSAPFELFAEVFQHFTLPVCREQELSADALACRTFGSRAFISALQKVSGWDGVDIEDPERYAEIHQFDTHPPLRERVGAAQRYPAGEEPEEDPPALSLLAPRAARVEGSESAGAS